MLKMAASLLLILGGAGIGYARSREITEREKNLEILLQILFFLKGEIRCGNSSLPDAFREIAAKISGFFGTILRDAAQEMEDTGGKNLEEYTKKFLSGKSRRVAEERRNGDSSDSWAQTWLS